MLGLGIACYRVMYRVSNVMQPWFLSIMCLLLCNPFVLSLCYVIIHVMLLGYFRCSHWSTSDLGVRVLFVLVLYCHVLLSC